jgi:hypothetical protein
MALARSSIFTVLGAALLGSASQAQLYTTVPNNLAAKEGTSQDHRPFAYRQVRLHHYIARSQLLALGNSANLTGLAFRRDGMIQVPANMTRVASESWSIRMANTTVNPLNPGSAYLSAALLAAVFVPKAINWPTLPIPASTPAPWMIDFPFDIPFSYTGGHLVIDHFSYDSNNALSDYVCDWERAAYGGGDALTFGQGCPAGENRCTAVVPNPGGGDLVMYQHGATPNGLSVAFLGSNNTNWGGIPLPFDLAGLGLNGCSLLIDQILSLGVMTFNSGLTEAGFPTPADPSLVGAKLFGQFINAQDPRVNPALMLSTSQGLEMTFGQNVGIPTPQMSVVYGVSNLANGRSGFVYTGEGPVVRIQY